MGRRSDHSRAEQEAMILDAGGQLMAQGGYARFSAREVAKRIGYSVGTVVNLFNGVDGLVVAINSATFRQWTGFLESHLHGADGPDRIVRLVDGYFGFARDNLNRWAAIYEHRLPPDVPMPSLLADARSALTTVVAREVAAVLPGTPAPAVASLTRSLIATVHGHCVFALNGSFAVLGENDPLALAVGRVTESLRANGAVL
ncbi:TetR/AcrR family transcriptional regulator [Sphingobium sufflavum]|uniref:TetR/AcrR family transcriptional regulator n=1 Tax=Sphingobium sufflavum TaxID=1129547 RepID=UPI001F38DCB8|nr:TetR/AcrR family transcriptional regulator [Sphingobium sufflavum]MCE7796911.1 TetR/AcrR family transcriptional regulator [Sphingobium sufflavum]